jgi:polyferredoxin
MALRHLRTVRVVAAVLLFVLTLFMFIDLAAFLPPWAVNVLTAPQLIPAIVRITSGAAVIGLAAVAILTLCFGRVYCSTICPLGTLQDVFSRLNRRRNSRRRFRYRRHDTLLHYGILALTVALALGGSLALLNLLEPFSNFGRLAGTLVRPIAILVNNGIAALLGTVHVYSIFSVPLRVPSPGAFVLASLFGGVLFAMSFLRGRLFCNTLCPAGALLGLMSRFSAFRIVIDKAACKECGLCEKVCKSECIDSGNMRVDFSACVGCFDCFDACPTVGLRYAGHRRRIEDAPAPGVNRRRRKILQGSAGAALMLLPGSDTLRSALPVPSGKSRSKLPISPPGSGSIERFTSRCTACHLCVSACPTQVLSPSFLAYGPGGFLQPRMDYSVSPCNYDCVLCGQVCPSGAILPLLPEAKRLVQIGKARFVKEDCIVITKKTECGACSEHCPTKAVHMVKTDGLFLPEVNDDLCIGCGSCEHPCPSTPDKAIYVESNPVHLTAKKPESKKAEPQSKPGADFPF